MFERISQSTKASGFWGMGAKVVVVVGGPKTKMYVGYLEPYWHEKWEEISSRLENKNLTWTVQFSLNVI